MALLVDSSVWISASKKNSVESTLLKEFILAHELIYITKQIQVEVCQGAKTERIFEVLWDSFLGFQFLDVTDFHWNASAWNYFRCRKKGITVSTIDCLIATVAREYRIPVWSLDHDFSLMQPIIGFDLAPRNPRKP